MTSTTKQGDLAIATADGKYRWWATPFRNEGGLRRAKLYRIVEDRLHNRPVLDLTLTTDGWHTKWYSNTFTATELALFDEMVAARIAWTESQIAAIVYTQLSQ